MSGNLAKVLLREGVIKVGEHFHQAKPYTSCHLVVRLRGQKYIGVGYAKWNPNDKDDPDYGWSEKVGKVLARARAMDDLADELTRAGVKVRLEI